MPAASATPSSFRLPSISQLLHAIPKATVGLLATFNGTSNACDASSRPSRQHGGGLQTEAYAQWQGTWLPQMQACLTEPWVQHFDPGRSVIECSLRTIASWEKSSADPEAGEVISRGMDHYRPRPAKASTTALTPSSSMEKLLEATLAIMRGKDAYSRIMEMAENRLWFYSSATMEDLGAPGHHYSVRNLRALLKEALGLESFMTETCLLSYQLHELATRAGEDINRLMPELMRTQVRREAFARRIDRDFVSSDARMNNRQVNILLRLLANYMTARNARMVS
jgi:hypothetical protein